MSREENNLADKEFNAICLVCAAGIVIGIFLAILGAILSALGIPKDLH